MTLRQGVANALTVVAFSRVAGKRTQERGTQFMNSGQASVHVRVIGLSLDIDKILVNWRRVDCGRHERAPLG